MKPAKGQKIHAGIAVLGRVACAVRQLSGESRFRMIAEEAMGYAITGKIVRANTAAPVLLADAEIRAEMPAEP